MGQLLSNRAAGTLTQSASPTLTGNWNFTPIAGVAITINAPAGQTGLQVAGTDTAVIGLNSSGLVNRSAILLQQGGVASARFGSDGSQVLLSDSINGDFCVVPNGHNFRIGTVPGGTTRFLRSNSNQLTLIAATAGDTLSVGPSPVTGALIASLVGLPNNAGALVGTLTNSPATGNPTKWFPINDGGTIRNIPSW